MLVFLATPESVDALFIELKAFHHGVHREKTIKVHHPCVCGDPGFENTSKSWTRLNALFRGHDGGEIFLRVRCVLCGK